MPKTIGLPNHLRPRREKVFGDGRTTPLDRNAKARIMFLARAISRKREPGHAYGIIKGKHLAVLEAPIPRPPRLGRNPGQPR